MTLEYDLSLQSPVPAAAGSAAAAASVLRRFSLGVIVYELLLALLIGGPVYVGCAAAAAGAYLLATQWAVRVADRNALAAAPADHSSPRRPDSVGQNC